MIKRKTFSMLVTVTGPSNMTAREIRKEMRDILRYQYDPLDQANIKMRSVTPAGVRASLYNNGRA